MSDQPTILHQLTLQLSESHPRYSTHVGRVIDNTAMKAYMTCPRKFLYSMMQHRRGRGLPTPALAYGSGWHRALQASYSAPQSDRATLVAAVEDYCITRWEKSTNPEDYRTFDRTMVEYERYLDNYGLPWDEPAQTVGWPDRPMVEITVDMPIPGARHPYAGKLDRIITENGLFLIEDHKTTSSMRADYFRQWELDSQMISYAALASIVTGLQIAGVRINLHVCRKSDSLFERRVIPFSPKRMQDWMAKYDEWLARIEDEVRRQAAGDPGAFPENFSACSGKYSMCEYAPVCSLDPSRRQYALEQDFDVAPWNPLESTEDSDA